MPEQESNAVKEIINLSIGGKETKRTFDFRCALIILAKHSTQIISSNHVQQLLNSLVEIQRIAYSSERDRTPKSVLRLHNMTWYHGILCREVFAFKLNEMTTRKLYGNYFHDITSHAAMQHRLISGKSCNVEEQERVFSTITNITKSTSSYHPSHIIGNVFVRLQAEKQMQAFQSSCVSKQQASVSKLAASLRPYGNTIIAHRIAEKHSRSWQAHLERISDFLLIGKGNWWIEHKNGDVEFHDGEQSPDVHPQGPSLHHFRSSNFNDEEKYLQECWKKCLCLGVVLPAKVLRIENDQGNLNVIHSCISHSRVSINNIEAENDVQDEPVNTEDTSGTTEETIVSFQLAPQSTTEISPNELDDDDDVVEADQNHLSLVDTCVTTDQNDGTVEGINIDHNIIKTEKIICITRVHN